MLFRSGDSAIERLLRLDFASGWSNLLSRLCLEFAHDFDFASGWSNLPIVSRVCA